jgi:hypothetical protein
MEGIDKLLRSDQVVDNIVLSTIDDDNDSEDNRITPPSDSLPGAKSSGRDDGSRTTRPAIMTSAIKFSLTGREWAAVTTQGLQVCLLRFVNRYNI